MSPRRLAQLQRRLVRESDRPPVPEEHEMVEGGDVGRRFRLERPLTAGDRVREVLAEVCPEQRQHGCGESSLHDRTLVGEVHDDPPAGCLEDRAAGHGRDRHGASPIDVRKRPDDLRRCPAAADRHDRIVAAAGRELGGGEGIGLAGTAGLSDPRVGLGDEQRRAAPDRGHAFAGARQVRGDLANHADGARPARGLTRDLVRDFAHLVAL